MSVVGGEGKGPEKEGETTANLLVGRGGVETAGGGGSAETVRWRRRKLTPASSARRGWV